MLSSDDEFSFQFDDAIVRDYDRIIRDLRAKDSSDLEEINGETKINCPQEDCTRSFTRKHNLIKHIKSHELGLDRPGKLSFSSCLKSALTIELIPGSICHICGKNIKGVYSLHLKVHENTKQFKCDDCGRCFRQKIALNNHCKFKSMCNLSYSDDFSISSADSQE